MTAIVFETPGLIDIRAFTTMGISVKPNSDHPIGQFGTGLKYAIAILIRMGAEPVVWIGKDQYIFYKQPINFRGREIDTVYMRAKKFPQRMFRIYELPYTTEYGKFWEPWMAFRELEANTRDEGGGTYDIADGLAVFEETWRRDPRHQYHTAIVVDHPAFVKVWENRDEIFLPRASSKIKGDEILEVFEGANRFLYYRGMKVLELGKPAMFTYNILREMELSEDRTLKYEFYATMALGDFVAKSENADFVRRIVTARSDAWESAVDFSSWHRPVPGPTFMRVVREKPEGLREQAQTHYRSWEPQPTIKKTDDLAEGHPTPWRVVADWIEDARKTNVFQKPHGYKGDWKVVAEKIVDLFNEREENVSEVCESGEGLPAVRDTEGTDALRLGAGIPTEDSAQPDASVPF